MPTWIVIGASRGIGLELVRQILAQGHQVIAAVRDPTTANQLWQLAGRQTRPGSCVIEQCDVTSQTSIEVSLLQPEANPCLVPNANFYHCCLRSRC